MPKVFWPATGIGRALPLTLVALGLLITAACTTADEATEAGTLSADDQTTNIRVEVTTSSGTVGQNHDDEHCVWRSPSYVLRDGTGEIIESGDVASSIPGEAEAAGEPAQLGEIRTSDPYECQLPFTIDEVPEADLYELEVTTQKLSGPLTSEDPTEEISASATVLAEAVQDQPTDPITVDIG